MLSSQSFVLWQLLSHLCFSAFVFLTPYPAAGNRSTLKEVPFPLTDPSAISHCNNKTNANREV